LVLGSEFCVLCALCGALYLLSLVCVLISNF